MNMMPPIHQNGYQNGMGYQNQGLPPRMSGSERVMGQNDPIHLNNQMMTNGFPQAQQSLHTISHEHNGPGAGMATAHNFQRQAGYTGFSQANLRTQDFGGMGPNKSQYSGHLTPNRGREYS